MIANPTVKGISKINWTSKSFIVLLAHKYSFISILVVYPFGRNFSIMNIFQTKKSLLHIYVHTYVRMIVKIDKLRSKISFNNFLQV